MTNLKYLALIGLFIFGIASASAQFKVRFATDVRYIAGGYIDKRPQFNTLEAALNDVLPYATTNRPYVFWVDSDTLNIADWDSVFTASGLTMKDSIDIYYVAEGKIKWAGFGFGGTGGTGGSPIPSQTQTTTHYSYPNWDRTNSALALWIRQQAAAIDSIDQHIWDLIVYTDSTYLYIENDTLKLRIATITALVSLTANRPDTTIIAYKTLNQTITGDWEFDGDITIDAGSIRLPAANNRTSTSRIIWDSGNRPYYSGNGAAGDSAKFAMIDLATGYLETADIVGWPNLDDATKDSITLGTSPIYNEVFWYSDDPDTVDLLTGGGWLTVGDWTEGHNAGITVSTDSSLTIVTTGLYQIGYSLSFTGVNSQVVEAGMFVDETLHPGSGFWRKIGTGADVGSASGTFLAQLTAGEVLELKLRSPGVTGDVILHIGNWNMTRIK